MSLKSIVLLTLWLSCADSGMRPPDKRDGAGSHNWGTVVDDME